MAEDLIKGVSGGVYRGGREIFRINSFTANAANGNENVTDFGSDGVERAFTGVVDWTGTFSGQYPVEDTSTGGTVDSQQVSIVEMSDAGGTLASALWKFQMSTRSMLYGTVLVTDFSLDNTAEGLGAFSGSWGSNGRLTYATSTST